MLTSRRRRQQIARLPPRLRLWLGRSATAVVAAMAQYKGAASEAGRAMHLMKKREKQREQMEQMKQRIAEVRTGPGRPRACAPPAAPTPGAPRDPDSKLGRDPCWLTSSNGQK